MQRHDWRTRNEGSARGGRGRLAAMGVAVAIIAVAVWFAGYGGRAADRGPGPPPWNRAFVDYNGTTGSIYGLMRYLCGTSNPSSRPCPPPGMWPGYNTTDGSPEALQRRGYGRADITNDPNRDAFLSDFEERPGGVLPWIVNPSTHLLQRQ